MAVGRGFFLCSHDCPKQSRTSFPFYKLFYLTISARISDCRNVHRKSRQDGLGKIHHFWGSFKSFSLLPSFPFTIQKLAEPFQHSASMYEHIVQSFFKFSSVFLYSGLLIFPRKRQLSLRHLSSIKGCS